MINESDYIEKLASGDHDAFRYIFMKYYPKMKYFIAHIVNSEAIAEELSQDVFEKIWKNRSELPRLHSFNSYVYRMSKNIAFNYNEHKQVERNYLQNREVSREVHMEEEMDAKEIEQLVMFEVKRMPEQRRRIFTMSRYENLKNEEIAEMLQITKKTVENHLNLALKQIRKIISLFLVFLL